MTDLKRHYVHPNDIMPESLDRGVVDPDDRMWEVVLAADAVAEIDRLEEQLELRRAREDRVRAGSRAAARRA